MWFFFFKQKTSYEMRISDWSSDVCSSDLLDRRLAAAGGGPLAFSVPASALYDAMRDTQGVTLKSLSHRTDGTLTTTLAAPRADDLNQVLLALQARGYRVTAQPLAGTDGQQMANITVRAVPWRPGDATGGQNGRAACRGRVWPYG